MGHVLVGALDRLFVSVRVDDVLDLDSLIHINGELNNAIQDIVPIGHELLLGVSIRLWVQAIFDRLQQAFDVLLKLLLSVNLV
jgi:hypothetical protein